MREVYREIAKRLRDGERCALATLVAMREASPAPIGTSLLVDDDGCFLGNIGAGCHEAELVEAARAALVDGIDRTIAFDLRDELLDGSICGASLEVAVWVADTSFAPAAERIALGEEAVTFRCALHRVTIEAKRPLVIVGATDLCAYLARAANEDFLITVVDPRPAFATRARHPLAHRLIVGWPSDVLPAMLSRNTALAIVAHDAKIDLPAVRCALESDVAYIGVLGNRRTQRARALALRELGYGPDALARIHGPAGLDLGAVSSNEVACSILAEVLSVLNDCSAMPLRSTEHAIHRDHLRTR